MELNEILKIFRIMNEKGLRDVEEGTGMSDALICEVEHKRRLIKGNQLEKLALFYGMDYSQIMAIYHKSREEQWSYEQALCRCLEGWLNQNGSVRSEGEQVSYQEALAEVLRAFRIVCKKSRAEVAAKTGYCVGRMYSVESGKSTITLKRLSEFALLYNVRVSKILEIQEDSMNNGWNFPRVLYEVTKVWMKENS